MLLGIYFDNAIKELDKLSQNLPYFLIKYWITTEATSSNRKNLKELLKLLNLPSFQTLSWMFDVKVKNTLIFDILLLKQHDLPLQEVLNVSSLANRCSFLSFAHMVRDINRQNMFKKNEMSLEIRDDAWERFPC